MAARSYTNIVTQIGVETTAGTAVGANKQLPTTSIVFTPEIEAKFTRAQGFKYPTQGALQRQWTTGTFQGPLSYNEIVYPLSGLVGTGTPALSNVAAYTWTFAPNSAAADSPKTFTMQRGDATAAQQTAYGIFNSLTVTITRQDCTISGTILGQKLTDGTSLTSSPTVIAQVPVSENEIDIFLDTAFGSIGTTKLTDPYETVITFPNFFNPKWVLNTTNASWKEAVEIARDSITISVKVEYNAQMSTIFQALTTNQLPVRYLRVAATGPVITGSSPSKNNSLAFDFAVKIMKCQDLGDHEGVYAYDFQFQCVHDSSMGKAFSLVVVNGLSAL
jgi:hypothetical protein